MLNAGPQNKRITILPSPCSFKKKRKIDTVETRNDDDKSNN
jgi:hypothetical protein